LRSFLTSLGIIIGIGSVVLMLAVSHGVSSTVTQAFADLGTGRISVVPSAPVGEGTGSRGGGFSGIGRPVASTLTVEDADALRDLDGVEASAPVVEVPTSVAGPMTTLTMAITGTTPDYHQVTALEIRDGRPFADGVAEVTVSESAAELLFGDGEVIGQALQIDGQAYTVVGVTANQQVPFGPRAAEGDGSAPRSRPVVMIPVQNALALATTQYVSQILVQADAPEAVDSVVERSRAVLLARHGGVQSFAIVSAQDLLASFNQIFDVLTVGLAVIAGISLLVGGIGIMNIMLVSVTERTREIGIAKAIGATRRNVVLQFLIEAVLLSLIGGLLGLALAWAGTVGAQQFLDVPATITPGAVALAVGVSVAIGLFFGVAPAWRAARLDPIAALRHE
jgi:putative ABC transport system permease protein